MHCGDGVRRVEIASTRRARQAKQKQGFDQRQPWNDEAFACVELSCCSREHSGGTLAGQEANTSALFATRERGSIRAGVRALLTARALGKHPTLAASPMHAAERVESEECLA